jgi:hypothetical protein
VTVEHMICAPMATIESNAFAEYARQHRDIDNGVQGASNPINSAWRSSSEYRDVQSWLAKIKRTARELDEMLAVTPTDIYRLTP